jgi:3-hydroxyisobutyrate dehydrogenase-like beta-hydroxyacid dehydrogenase
MRLGFVGAGRMGRPMVHRLVAAGYRVQALGRSFPAREALTTDGARAVPSAGAAGAGADVVLICVYTDEQVRDVCLDSELLAGMPSGSVLVVHTTCSPHTIEAVAARAARDRRRRRPRQRGPARHRGRPADPVRGRSRRRPGARPAGAPGLR